MTRVLMAALLAVTLSACAKSPSHDLTGRQWGGVSDVVGRTTR